MSRIQVYSKSGAQKFVVGGIEYHDEWMGRETVTVTLTSAVPMSIEIGDWLEYRGLTYTIYNVPSALKCARSGSYGDAFKYENVKFESRSTELTEIRMLDYVLADDEEPNSNTLHYSSLPDFSFYCETVDDFADRMQANTNRWCKANGLFVTDWWIWLTPSRERSIQRCLGDDLLEEWVGDLWDETYGSDDVNNTDEKVNQNVQVSNQSVWEVCTEIKDTFGLNFTMYDRVCYIGAPGIAVRNRFLYGKDNGLYEIERIADEDQLVVTKLYAYGSDKNMPIRYYANLNVACYGNATSLVNYICETNIPWRSTLFTTPMSEVVGHETETEAYYVKIRFRSHGTDYEGFVSAYERNDIVALAFNYTLPQDSIELMTQIWFESGIDVDKWPDNRKEYTTDNLPNNMSLNVLMLPGFPNQSLYDWVMENGGEAADDGNENVEEAEDVGLATWKGYTAWFSKDPLQPFILSENYVALGIKEGVKKFDGSDDTEEIYPTIENMPAIGGVAVDEIFAAETIKDNGVYGEGDTSPRTFTITLPSFGSDFDLKELFATGESVTISMKDGYCGGREFSVKSVAAQNNGGSVLWQCTCDRDHDDLLDLYFPYSYSMATGGDAEHVQSNEPYQVRAGDKYVLTGIKMTDTYIRAASERLLEVSLDFLANNDYTRYTYLPKIDEIFMARNAALDPTDTIHSELKAGKIMLFEDADLNVDGSVFIDTLTIKEDGNNGIPTYEVTLRNDKQVGTMQRIENKIDSITSGGAIGTGTSIPAIRSLIEAYGREYFLSRLNDDTARGVINFLEWLRVQNVPLPDWFVSAVDNDTVNGLLTYVQGLQSSGFVSGLQGSGFSLKVTPSGSTRLEVDDLLIRHLLEASEIDIHKKSYTSGYQSFGSASGKIYRVEPVTNVSDDVVAYKIWFVRSDDSESVKNDWRVGDMAACETFNLVKVESGSESYRNRRWWRLVTETGVGYVENEECNYIVVSDVYGIITVTDNNVSVNAWGKSSNNDSTPEIGDDVVQQGSVINTTRQNLYVIAVNNADENNEAGHWIYKNIGSDTTSAATQYNLTNHVWSKETTHEVILRADRFYLTTQTGDEELKSTTRYYLRLSPQVINTSTFDGQYVVATAWKQNGTDAPVALTSADGFAIYVSDIENSSGGIIVPREWVSTDGTLSFQWYSTHTYSDIILYDKDPRYIPIGGDSAVEYDRQSLAYVSDGAQGDPGEDGTSFTVKGNVLGYFADMDDVLSGYYDEGDKVIADDGREGAAVYILENYPDQWSGEQASIGDAYVQVNDEQAGYNHIFCFNGTYWSDLGQIQGQDGTDGKDAAILRADISTIVIEETKTRNGSSYDISYPSLPKTITVSGMVGNTSLPSSSIVIGNVGVSGAVTGVTVSSNTITLNSNNIHSTYTEGYIDIPCSTTYDNITYQDTIRVNVYVNRLGTWKMEVEDETMQMISESLGYGTDGEVLRRNTVIAQDSYQVGLSAWLNGVMRSAIKVKTNGEIEVIADLINALNSVLTAKSLVSDSGNGLRVEIENGLLVVKYNNVIRIALGLVDNNPVLTFYDALGVKLYDLGPEGIKWMAVQEAHLVLWNIRGFVNYGPNGGIRQAPDGFLHNAMLEYVPYIVEDREDVIDGFVPFGSAIYKVYLKEWNGIFEYNHARYPYTDYETGGTDTMEIREGDDTPSPEYNQRWMTSPIIYDSTPSNLFNVQAVVIGSAWIEYIGSTAPADYYEADYPSDYRISDWSSSVEYKRIAIFQDAELLAERKVYRLKNNS